MMASRNEEVLKLVLFNQRDAVLQKQGMEIETLQRELLAKMKDLKEAVTGLAFGIYSLPKDAFQVYMQRLRELHLQREGLMDEMHMMDAEGYRATVYDQRNGILNLRTRTEEIEKEAAKCADATETFFGPFC